LDKVALFTHLDMDGAGVEIVVRNEFPNIQNFYRCNYENIILTLNTFIDNYNVSEYIVIIGDLAIRKSQESVAVLDYLFQNAIRVIICDHHVLDSKWIDIDYGSLPNADIHIKDDTSGSRLTWHALDDTETYDELTWLINDYDCWYNTTPHSKRLNMLFGLLGYDNFVDRFLINPSVHFTDAETLTIDIETKHRDHYLETISKTATCCLTPGGQKTAILFASQFISEVGEHLLSLDPELEIVIMLNLEKLTGSVRSRNGQARDVAINLGGGGHPDAAGFRLTTHFSSIIDQLRAQCMEQQTNL